MFCTYSSPKGVRCQEEAGSKLVWSESIVEGWEVTNQRALCAQHVAEVTDRLTQRGVRSAEMKVEELGA